ncbi:hypothetical protein PAEPH01_0810 [Pancytospora epiphaga]|nr:hypothetical protein PAEPH01_0810 [Pancytospora epiphaga]
MINGDEFGDYEFKPENCITELDFDRLFTDSLRKTKALTKHWLKRYPVFLSEYLFKKIKLNINEVKHSERILKLIEEIITEENSKSLKGMLSSKEEMFFYKYLLYVNILCLKRHKKHALTIARTIWIKKAEYIIEMIKDDISNKSLWCVIKRLGELFISIFDMKECIKYFNFLLCGSFLSKVLFCKTVVECQRYCNADFKLYEYFFIKNLYVLIDHRNLTGEVCCGLWALRPICLPKTFIKAIFKEFDRHPSYKIIKGILASGTRQFISIAPMLNKLPFSLECLEILDFLNESIELKSYVSMHLDEIFLLLKAYKGKNFKNLSNLAISIFSKTIEQLPINFLLSYPHIVANSFALSAKKNMCLNRYFEQKIPQEKSDESKYMSVGDVYFDNIRYLAKHNCQEVIKNIELLISYLSPMQVSTFTDEMFSSIRETNDLASLEVSCKLLKYGKWHFKIETTLLEELEETARQNFDLENHNDSKTIIMLKILYQVVVYKKLLYHNKTIATVLSYLKIKNEAIVFQIIKILNKLAHVVLLAQPRELVQISHDILQSLAWKNDVMLFEATDLLCKIERRIGPHEILGAILFCEENRVKRSNNCKVFALLAKTAMHVAVPLLLTDFAQDNPRVGYAVLKIVTMLEDMRYSHLLLKIVESSVTNEDASFRRMALRACKNMITRSPDIQVVFHSINLVWFFILDTQVEIPFNELVKEAGKRCGCEFFTPYLYPGTLHSSKRVRNRYEEIRGIIYSTTL